MSSNFTSNSIVDGRILRVVSPNPCSESRICHRQDSGRSLIYYTKKNVSQFHKSQQKEMSVIRQNEIKDT
jgi:hypothetical protein